MSPSSPFAPARFVRGIKRLVQGRPKCLKLVRSAVTGKSGLEIGGPSPGFRQRFNLPIYDLVASLDNCDFSQANTWASHQQVYRFSPGKPCGRSFFAEGTDLREIADGTYDFVLSSHNLEHIANPIKALKEWQRVVRPGGHLILILPHYAHTFDRRRTPTTVEHMLDDFNRNVGEDDLTHVEDSVKGQSGMWGPDEENRRSLMNNFSHRMMHHHVFEQSNSRGLLEAAGLDVLAVERQDFQIFLVARTAQTIASRQR